MEIRASEARTPHTRQTNKQKSGKNMTPNASKEGKLDRFGGPYLCSYLLMSKAPDPLCSLKVWRNLLKSLL